MSDGVKSEGRYTRVGVNIEHENHVWLWQERRRRERSIAWLVNEAVRQYRQRLEKQREKSDLKPTDAD